MSVDTTGELNFYSHTIDGSPPWVDGTAKLGWTTSNYVRIPTRLPIHDLRGRENDFSLDKNGFEVHKYVGNIHDVFDDKSEAQQSYYEDVRNILKNHLGASRNPVFYPHVDSNPPAATFKVKEILGEEEADKLLIFGNH